MNNQFTRFEPLIGKASLDVLHNSRIAIFGIGGVGSYVAETLVRSGIGAIDIIDNDMIDVTNINRQLIATHSNIGKLKVDVMKQRLIDINPNCKVNAFNQFYDHNTYETIDLTEFHYVADAIDTISSKVLLITRCLDIGTPIISSMGTGNKLNPEKLTITDLSKTSVCPLARIIRKQLKSYDIEHLTVLFSDEMPIDTNLTSKSESHIGRRSIPASSPFVPSVGGILIASHIIKDLIKV